MAKPKCVRCKKTIGGKIKIETRARKVGNKSIQEVDYYCEPCFKTRSKEKCIAADRKKKAAHKG